MHPICRRTANQAVHMTTEWAGLISRVSPYAGLYDIVNGSKLSFVRPGSVVKQFAQDLVTIPANVPAISGGCNWLEGAAQNVNTWSNEFTAARGHTLTDCTTVPSTTEYCLTDINGAPRYATVLTATANNGRVGKYNISVTSGTPLAVSIYAKKGKGRGRFTGYDGSNAVIGYFNFDTGAFENITDAGGLLGYFKADPLANGWYRLSCIWTPKVTGTNGASSIGCELANDWCYISGSQFESNARVATSYIYTEASSVTRASAGADTSGNGLSMPLSQAMLNSLGSYWTARASAADNSWYSVCWSSELRLFCAVANSGTGNRVMTSPDGVVWTARASAADNNWQSVCWSSELRLFCAVANTGTGNRVMTSPDPAANHACTCIQWIDISSMSDIGSNTISITTPWNVASGILYITQGSIRGTDGVNVATLSGLSALSAGRYAVISQHSSIMGRMRVGLYNPTTGTLTWSHPTLGDGAIYRRFFPIHSSNSLRWFYGGGNYPIGIGAMSWFNRILSSSQILQVCKETRI